MCYDLRHRLDYYYILSSPIIILQNPDNTVQIYFSGIIGTPITPFGSYRLFHERADGSGRRTAARYRNDRGTRPFHSMSPVLLAQDFVKWP